MGVLSKESKKSKDKSEKLKNIVEEHEKRLVYVSTLRVVPALHFLPFEHKIFFNKDGKSLIDFMFQAQEHVVSFFRFFIRNKHVYKRYVSAEERYLLNKCTDKQKEVYLDILHKEFGKELEENEKQVYESTKKAEVKEENVAKKAKNKFLKLLGKNKGDKEKPNDLKEAQKRREQILNDINKNNKQKDKNIISKYKNKFSEELQNERKKIIERTLPSKKLTSVQKKVVSFFDQNNNTKNMDDTHLFASTVEAKRMLFDRKHNRNPKSIVM